MTNTKILVEEILLDEEMEKVSGGTTEEFIDIAKFLPKITRVRYGHEMKDFMNKDQAQDWLKTNLNIDAEIGLGKTFFNIPGKPNIYSRNGESLTHEEVLTELKTFFNK